MRWKGLLMVAMVVCGQLQTAMATQEETLPQVVGRVADYAGIISLSQIHLLEQISSQHEFISKQRVAVVTIESSGAISPRHYAEQLHRNWDNERRDSGVVLVLYKMQRSAAIAVGEALRGKLNEAQVTAIISGEVGAKMRSGAFDEAAMDGFKAILGQLAEEH